MNQSTTYRVRNVYSVSPISRFVLCCTLLFTLFGFSQSAPKISSEVDTTSIKIGEQLHFTVRVDVDSTAQVIFPEGQTFSPLETVEAFMTDTIKNSDRLTLQKTYALTQFDSGSYKLPAQYIDINGKGYLTDSLEIHVATVAVDTLAQKMFDIKPLMEVEKSNAKFWLTLLVIIVALGVVGGLVYWFLFRKKPLTEAEKEALLPPYDRALLELKKLENSKYLIQSEYKKYYTELTNIVRSYLEEDAHITALESTTDQLITKLEMLKDAGELKIDNDTLYQFRRILQTADLVKFAKSKPDSSVAEQDRKSIEQIVTRTHDALPEPTEEDLMEQEEYLEELNRQEQRKKWKLAGGIALGLLLVSLVSLTVYYGPGYVWDTVTLNPTKRLLEKEWVSSSYGYPPINLQSPEVLVRQENQIPPEAKAQIKELQTFVYQDNSSLLSIAVNSTTFTQAVEPDHKKTIEQVLQGFEQKGARNIITKQEEFTTITGVKGIKTFGSGKFKIPDSNELISGNYIILSFGGQGFQQQVFLTWQDDDPYSQEIVDRIVQTVEVKTEA